MTRPPRSEPPAPVGRGRKPGGGRVRAAFALALAIDGLQVVLLPLTLAGGASPFVHGIDVVAAVVFTVLLGWHWAFLPSFVAELVPVVELVPSWTLAVWLATRGLRKDPAA